MSDETPCGSEGEPVVKTGTYMCAACGPDGIFGGRVHVFRGGSMVEVKSTKPTFRFFKEGETFCRCPGCTDLANRAGSPIGSTGSWVFQTEENTARQESAGCGAAMLLLGLLVALIRCL